MSTRIMLNSLDIVSIIIIKKTKKCWGGKINQCLKKHCNKMQFVISCENEVLYR